MLKSHHIDVSARRVLFYLLETKGMNITQKTSHFILAKSYVVKRWPIQNPGTTFSL